MADAFDALVIGGGPAGATTALLLARAGWSVVLLERKDFPRRKVCGEYLSATNLPLLAHLGVGEVFRETAGPEVREVGLFAGRALIRAELPRPAGIARAWGRALGREHLDTLLLQRAVQAGVEVRQPCSAVMLVREGDAFHCQARVQLTGATAEIQAKVVIAAHGSWDAGPLPTQTPRLAGRPGDLLAFKAHFQGSDLPSGLMPLLAFPGGYGGMVHSDGGRVSLSCCIRRDQLALLRRQADAATAGDAVLDHIVASCDGVRRALARASRLGPWLAAGPIRPGIRRSGCAGIFLAGNCAGEAHPVIAEGISMALQSGWLLADRLQAWRQDGGRTEALQSVGRDYARRWRRSFAPRLHAAAAVAHWAMQPALVAASLPLVRCFPSVLSWGARLSGKATQVVGSRAFYPEGFAYRSPGLPRVGL